MTWNEAPASARDPAASPAAPDFPPFAAVIAVLLGAVFGYSLAYMHPGLLSDEIAHGLQAWDFYNGQFAIRPEVMTFPGYHAALAGVAWVTGYYHDLLHRFVTMGVGLLLPFVAYRIILTHAPADAGIRAVTTYFLPLLFPYFFLIYTDTWASLVILTLCLAAIGRMRFTVALLALLAVVIRQDAAIWVGFAWLLMALDGLEWEAIRSRPAAVILDILKRTWPLTIAIIAIGLLLILNKGVEAGNPSIYKSGILLNPTNGFFFLLVCWGLFLPQNLDALPRIAGLLKIPGVLTALVAGLLIYLFLFSNPHPLNGPNFGGFLHNRLIIALADSIVLRLLAFVLIAWMVLTFAVSRFHDPRLFLILPVGFVAAIAHPLIEHRYYLPALLLYQVFRPSAGRILERLHLLLSILVTAYLMTAIFSGKFFL